VKSGALRGLEGFLVRKKGETRLVISVNLLERSVAAEVDASMVEKVTAAVRKEATDIVSAGPGSRYRDGICSAGIMPDPLQMVSAQVSIAPR
jgi:hypothetical protein